jgi:hypothetical protein
VNQYTKIPTVPGVDTSSVTVETGPPPCDQNWNSPAEVSSYDLNCFPSDPLEGVSRYHPAYHPTPTPLPT